MASDLIFDPGPTQSAFVQSDAEVVMLMGPMGEGKTFAGIFGVIRHAERCRRPIRGALIRDTHQNIKISTAPDIKEVLRAYATFHDDDKKMIIHSTPRVEMDLFGIDDPASLSKLQGPQYAIIWMEEPAPIIEKANAGLPREVFNLSLARASRQKDTRMRVQITQNPADEDHWTEELANAPRILARDPDTGVEIRKEVFRISRGENKHLNPQTRAANLAAFEEGTGQYIRYILGKAAPVRQGVQVTPEYSRERHYTDEFLDVIPGAVGVRGWDAWQNPCCVMGQLVQPGRLIVHDVVRGENIGIKELIEQLLLPLLHTPKYRNRIDQWRDIGDPSMRTPDQSSSQQSAARIVESLLGTRFEPGPTRWPARINPLKSALVGGATDGGPKIVISRSAYFLHRTLNGGWHFKKDNSGNIIGNLPVKDSYSHPGDALSYLVSVIFPYAVHHQSFKPMPRDIAMRQAMSYRGGNYGRRRAAR